jgi:hypothetical protein
MTQLQTDNVAFMDLPAQVMLPHSPPTPIVDYLRDHPSLAVLRGDGLRQHRWDLARVISSDELRQHRRIHMSLRAPERDPAECRFAVFYWRGPIDASVSTWERLPDPDGRGFTELDLQLEETAITYAGQRRKAHWSPTKNQGALKGSNCQLLVIVLPPAAVRGVRSAELSAWMPRGLDHSNWKWLVVTVE